MKAKQWVQGNPLSCWWMYFSDRHRFLTTSLAALHLTGKQGLMFFCCSWGMRNCPSMTMYDSKCTISERSDHSLWWGTQQQTMTVRVVLSGFLVTWKCPHIIRSHTSASIKCCPHHRSLANFHKNPCPNPFLCICYMQKWYMLRNSSCIKLVHTPCERGIFQILLANGLACQVWQTHLQRQLSQALPAALHHYSKNNNFRPPVIGLKMFWISSNTEQNFITELYLRTVQTPWTSQNSNYSSYILKLSKP